MKYIRRFRMEVRCDAVSGTSELPDGYRWVRWTPELARRHARVKFLSFRSEIDTRLFSCFETYRGCLKLMNDICRQSSFFPDSTWLIAKQSFVDLSTLDCGTIQGMRVAEKLGAIQNVGIIRDARGLGLGRALVVKAIEGFRETGAQRVYLEVTADNRPAVALYESLGFRVTRTMFKAARRFSAPVRV
ncbi:GNAT family N-acetyltransferase [Stratiformator vulcanicus]|uniref:Mycothiol acetyltransferase n=1 Tax=Stratiformator vulcanicus TaxID=2527980 RepID=A0A517QZR7_9PLAN|nr:N-acetyltransferase [Stratiformator vulcanicus]QDT37142.1 Mycothiol acetyltransferase [Stratiformator vulcanicus]